MAMTLTEADEEYSLYTDSYERHFRIRDVILKQGMLPNSLPIGELWAEFAGATDFILRSPASTEALFLDYLTALGVTPIALVDILFCAFCRAADWTENICTSTEDGLVCNDCADTHYTECTCGRMYRTSVLENTGQRVDSDLICQHCIDNYYTFCDACDEWVHQDNAAAHDHDEEEDEDNDSDGRDYHDYCCPEFATQFRVRNGSKSLPSGKKLLVCLPDGTIDETGLDTLSVLFRTVSQEKGYDTVPGRAYYQLARDVYDLPDDGEKTTGYAKRLSKRAYDSYKIKLPPALLAQIGTIAANHSRGVTVTIEVTRHLNMQAREFYHSESCWWGDTYGESRCALKSNGGFGLRSFHDNGYLSGRAWVLPLKLPAYGDRQPSPTFNARTPDALMVFNGYGELDGYTPARVLAQLYGWTYKKWGYFEASPMYVNCGGGYLVTSPELISRFPAEISLRLPRHAGLYETEKAALLAAAAQEGKETADVA